MSKPDPARLQKVLNAIQRDRRAMRAVVRSLMHSDIDIGETLCRQFLEQIGAANASAIQRREMSKAFCAGMFQMMHLTGEIAEYLPEDEATDALIMIDKSLEANVKRAARDLN